MILIDNFWEGFYYILCCVIRNIFFKKVVDEEQMNKYLHFFFTIYKNDRLIIIYPLKIPLSLIITHSWTAKLSSSFQS